MSPSRRRRALLGSTAGCLAALLAAAPGSAQEPFTPTPEVAPGWEVASLLEGSGLEHETILHLAFADDGSVWLGSTAGLLHFDGIHWRRYGKECGLPSTLVRCVAWTRTGRLWIGTDRGAGTMASGRYVAAEELAGRSVRRIVEDHEGSLWFCCDRWPDMLHSGGLIHRRDGEITVYDQSTGLADDEVFGFLATRGGQRFVLTSTGMSELRPDGSFCQVPVAGADTAWTNHPPLAIVESKRLGVVVGNTRSHFLLRDGALQPAPGGNRHGPGALVATREEGTVYTCRPSAEFVRFWTVGGDRMVPASSAFRSYGETVETLAEAPDGAIWAAGQGLLLRLQVHDHAWTAFADLPAPRLSDGERVWFADERQVVMGAGRHWQRIADARMPIVASRHGEVFCRAANGAVVRFRAGERTDFGSWEVGVPRAGRLVVDGTDTLWAVGDDGRMPALAFLRGDRWTQVDCGSWHRPGDVVQRVFADAAAGVWLLTAEPQRRLIFVDGGGPARAIEVPAALRLWDHVDLLSTPDGGLWVFGTLGLWRRDHAAGRWERHQDVAARQVAWGHLLDNVPSFGLHGTAGARSGVLILDRTVRRQPLPAPGRCVGSSGRGLFVRARDELLVVDALGPPRALPLPAGARVRRVVESPGGDLWLDAETRVLRFRPPQMPPVALLHAPAPRCTAGAPVPLEVTAARAFTPRGAVDLAQFTFSYRIDNGAWSTEVPLTESFELPAPDPGRHSIAVRVRDAFDRLSAPGQTEIEVLPPPLQQRWWFAYALAGIGAALCGLLVHALIARRNLRSHARHLSRAVASRTADLRAELRTRLRFEQQLRGRNVVLQQLATGQPLDEALRELVRCIEAQLVISRAAVLMRSDGERLVIAAADRLDRALIQQLENARLGTDGNIEAADGAPSLAELAAARGFAGCRSQPIRSNDGSLLGSVCLFLRSAAGSSREIEDTLQAAANIAAIAIDSKRVEAERRRLQQQMLQAQKLESLGLLAGGIAHDFNNLLTGILGHTGLAKTAIADPATVELLEQVEHTGQRAADLCNQLLAYSGRGRFVVRPTDVSAMLAETAQMLRLSIPCNVSLDLDLQPGLPAVEVDVTQIRQVTMNLLRNAVEAIGEADGRIVVRTALVHAGTRRLRQADLGGDLAGGRYVMMEVRDTGCGMSEATRRSLFDPFFTTKFTGRGLGMAAVHGIIRGHRGAVEIVSSPGSGATFRVLLPASEKPVVLETLAPAGQATERRFGGTVLVADDEPTVREVSQAVLEDAGYRVVLAADGQEAIDAFTTDPEGADILLLDLMMPHLTGEEVLRRVRERDSELPVILSSGYDLIDVGARHASDDRVTFLKKPYSPRELLTCVNQMSVAARRRPAAAGRAARPS